MSGQVNISKQRGVGVPSLPYAEMLSEVLGPSYELSLVFVGKARARAINKKTRRKSYAPNVLSFPLSKTSGEIYLCSAVAAKEADDYDLAPDAFVGKLFIHGLFHLKGMQHGSRMESQERRIGKKFRIF